MTVINGQIVEDASGGSWIAPYARPIFLRCPPPMRSRSSFQRQ